MSDQMNISPYMKITEPLSPNQQKNSVTDPNR